MIEFSVVVPTHNRPEKLAQLLASLSQQTMETSLFEVLVIATEKDPAFTSIEASNYPFSLKLKFIPEDPTKGRSASAKRNFGAELAKAPWLAFIDDDCVADENWLSHAKKKSKGSFAGIEGLTKIPQPDKETLTYKGIRRLSRPQGYQTCNIFYRKDSFLSLGGFDPKFPFYLEDTDFAWTLLDNGGQIAFAEDVVAEHPVPLPEPKRLLDNAVRMRKMPYLFKKHPERYTHSRMRALPRPYALFLAIEALALMSLCLGLGPLAIIFLGMRIIGTVAYTVRMFWGLHWVVPEALATLLYMFICPIVSLVQLMRGNLEQKTFLLLR